MGRWLTTLGAVIAMKKITAIYILSVLLLAGCQNNPDDMAAVPTSSVVWTTTKNLDTFIPLLFTRDDLGWKGGKYAFEEEAMSLRDVVQAEDVAGVYLDLEPRVDLPKGRSKPGSILGAHQLVWIYSSEEKAAESIKFERTRFDVGLRDPANIELRLSNEIIGCRMAYDPVVKDYYNCNYMGQHGRYLTVAGMAVEGTVVTLEDWSRFIRVIQDRMIAQVEKDGEVYPTP